MEPGGPTYCYCQDPASPQSHSLFTSSVLHSVSKDVAFLGLLPCRGLREGLFN